MFGFPSWTVLLVVSAMSAAAASWGMHEIDLGTINGMKAEYAKAETAAVKQAEKLQYDVDQIALAAAVGEAQAQEKIVTQTVTIRKEIPVYVKDTSTCVTYGLIRVLDAAVQGRDPAELSLPAGQSNDACAPVSAPALADNITTNYGAAHQNAEQLNGLEDWATKTAALAPAPP